MGICANQQIIDSWITGSGYYELTCQGSRIRSKKRLKPLWINFIWIVADLYICHTEGEVCALETVCVTLYILLEAAVHVIVDGHERVLIGLVR